MKFSRNPLRDVVVLTLPVMVLLVYLAAAAWGGFFESEIENFHGYLNRNTRIGGPAYFARRSLEPLWNPRPRAYLPNLTGTPVRSETRSFDLRVDGDALDELRSALPDSAEVWQPALLVENGTPQRVQVRHRGQRFINFFFKSRTTWKIKTKKRQLVDDSRVINLSPLENRLHDHLAFLMAREMGLPSPDSRVVHLYLNQMDQGLYLQEEQVDESMIRRTGRMPGDIFYGELDFPDEPKLASKDLFWNPFLWRKKAHNNRYPEEHRPHLVDLLDVVSDESPQSYYRLYELLDEREFPLYFIALSLFGDQHTDQTHNHRLYFNPLTGRFEGIVWNPMMSMARGKGLETMANPLFRKLCRDPRFLDRAYSLFRERLTLEQLTQRLIAELERIRIAYKQEALKPHRLNGQLNALRRRVEARHETLRRFEQVAEMRFEVQESSDQHRLVLFAKAIASLRLESLELDGDAVGVRLFEDRNFDGKIGTEDREILVEHQKHRLLIADPDAIVFVGRDLRAPYFEPSMEGEDSYTQYRQYTRLAFLESPYILIGPEGSELPSVVGIGASRTLVEGPVNIRQGSPEEYRASESIHPWRFPSPPVPRLYEFEGRVELEENLIVTARDKITVSPGTRFLLGPGISILIQSRVHLDRVQIERLNPEGPWGVLALQGQGALRSVIENSRLQGGSHATLNHVYYSGMVSIHDADHVTIKNTSLRENLLGDDTLRVAASRHVTVQECRVEHANGDAIDFDISSGSILDTKILQARGDGIDLMTSNVKLTGNVVRGAGDKGISIGEASISEVRDCTILESEIGIGIKDASEPLITEVKIQGCRTGISSYDKNWRYPGGGGGRLVNSTLSDNFRDLALDESSYLQVEACHLSEDFRPPEKALRERRLEFIDGTRSGGPE